MQCRKLSKVHRHVSAYQFVRRTRTGHFRYEPSTGYDAPQPMGNAMKRRSRAGGEVSEARRSKALKTKRGDASKTASSTAPSQDAEVARLTRELYEAREQQTATSEVLQVISSSPGELEPVFSAMLENAVRICDATFGNIYRWDGKALHLIATLILPLPSPKQVCVHRFVPTRKASPGSCIHLQAPAFGALQIQNKRSKSPT